MKAVKKIVFVISILVGAVVLIGGIVIVFSTVHPIWRLKVTTRPTITSFSDLQNLLPTPSRPVSCNDFSIKLNSAEYNSLKKELVQIEKQKTEPYNKGVYSFAPIDTPKATNVVYSGILVPEKRAVYISECFSNITAKFGPQEFVHPEIKTSN